MDGSRSSFPILLFLAAVAAWGTLPAQEEAVIRSEVRLVGVWAQITDQHGRPVPNLPREAFEVFEDGIRKEIQHFGSGETPINLALAIDTSQSVWENRRPIIDAAERLIEGLKDEDRLAIILFSSRWQVFRDFSPISDRQDLHRALEGLEGASLPLELSGNTHYYDCLAEILATKVGPLDQERKGVIVLSDGLDVSSDLSFGDLLRQAAGSGSIIYTVDAGYQRQARSELKLLAKTTGGDYFRMRSPKDLEKIYAAIAYGLRHLYVVGYYSAGTEEKGWHRLEVKVKRRGVRVVARPGYCSGPECQAVPQR